MWHTWKVKWKRENMPLRRRRHRLRACCPEAPRLWMALQASRLSPSWRSPPKRKAKGTRRPHSLWRVPRGRWRLRREPRPTARWMACQRDVEVGVGAGVVSRASQGLHQDLPLLRGGKVTVVPRLVAPSHRAALGAGVTPHQDRHTEALPTKAPRWGATGNPRTASTPPRSHISLGARAPPALEATHGSGQIILESTKKRVIITEINIGSDHGLMSAQAIVMSGTTLGTAGIGGEVQGS